MNEVLTYEMLLGTRVLIIVALLLLSNSARVCSADVVAVEAPGQRTLSTFCNPLPIPEYPVGRLARTVTNGEPIDESFGWLLDHKEQFRELADPTVLWYEGKWFLYPSVDMAWVSSNNGATWEHHPLNIRDVGYAPTVVKHGDRFLLLASQSPLYTANSPLGDFRETRADNVFRMARKSRRHIDPMLFSDDGGRLYYYWGCSPTDGIWAAELDANNPTNSDQQPGTSSFPSSPMPTRGSVSANGTRIRTPGGWKAPGC